MLVTILESHCILLLKLNATQIQVKDKVLSDFWSYEASPGGCKDKLIKATVHSYGHIKDQTCILLVWTNVLFKNFLLSVKSSK